MEVNQQVLLCDAVVTVIDLKESVKAIIIIIIVSSYHFQYLCTLNYGL